MEPVTLRTDRLILHPPRLVDAAAITAACQDPEIPRWTTVPTPYTREHADGFIELTEQAWADGSQAVWGIHAGDELVGVVGLHHIDEHPSGGAAELGYWATASARGQGFMVEASRRVIEYGFAQRELARIWWRAVVGNIPSARTARALGFRYEGMMRQSLTGSRGRDDAWAAGLLATDDRIPQAWPIALD